MDALWQNVAFVLSNKCQIRPHENVARSHSYVFSGSDIALVWSGMYVLSFICVLGQARSLVMNVGIKFTASLISFILLCWLREHHILHDCVLAISSLLYLIFPDSVETQFPFWHIEHVHIIQLFSLTGIRKVGMLFVVVCAIALRATSHIANGLSYAMVFGYLATDTCCVVIGLCNYQIIYYFGTEIYRFQCRGRLIVHDFLEVGVMEDAASRIVRRYMPANNSYPTELNPNINTAILLQLTLTGSRDDILKDIAAASSAHASSYTVNDRRDMLTYPTAAEWGRARRHSLELRREPISFMLHQRNLSPSGLCRKPWYEKFLVGSCRSEDAEAVIYEASRAIDASVSVMMTLFHRFVDNKVERWYLAWRPTIYTRVFYASWRVLLVQQAVVFLVALGLPNGVLMGLMNSNGRDILTDEPINIPLLTLIYILRVLVGIGLLVGFFVSRLRKLDLAKYDWIGLAAIHTPISRLFAFAQLLLTYVDCYLALKVGNTAIIVSAARNNGLFTDTLSSVIVGPLDTPIDYYNNQASHLQGEFTTNGYLREQPFGAFYDTDGTLTERMTRELFPVAFLALISMTLHLLTNPPYLMASLPSSIAIYGCFMLSQILIVIHWTFVQTEVVGRSMLLWSLPPVFLTAVTAILFIVLPTDLIFRKVFAQHGLGYLLYLDSLRLGGGSGNDDWVGRK